MGRFQLQTVNVYQRLYPMVIFPWIYPNIIPWINPMINPMINPIDGHFQLQTLSLPEGTLKKLWLFFLVVCHLPARCCCWGGCFLGPVEWWNVPRTVGYRLGFPELEDSGSSFSGKAEMYIVIHPTKGIPIIIIIWVCTSLWTWYIMAYHPTLDCTLLHITWYPLNYSREIHSFDA